VLKVRGWGRQKRVVRTGRKLEGPLHFSEPQPGPGERGHGSQIADLMTGDRAAWKVTRGLANGRVTVTQLAYGLCSATLPLCAPLRDANSAQISEEAAMSENAEQKNKQN
jgi:hypothetical protein